MRLNNILTSTVCLLALSNSTWAAVLEAPATSSETRIDTSSLNTSSVDLLTSQSEMLDSTLPTGLTAMQLPESGDQLADTLMPTSDLPQFQLLATEILGPNLSSDTHDKSEQTVEQLLAATSQKRSGFDFSSIGRSLGNPSLASFFIGMTFLGFVVGATRLEILRRRSENMASYDYGTASPRRQRDSVVYAHTTSNTHRAEQPRRRHRTSSSNGHRSHRRRSSHRATHPVTIQGRLAS